MKLLEELRKIQDLTTDTKLKITFTSGDSVIGKYKGYTDAEDNEPNVSQIDIEANDGTWYGLEETEIFSIEKTT